MARCRSAPRSDDGACRRGLRVIALLLAAVTGCSGSAERGLVLATTTSVEDSGLLDTLLPAFEAAHSDVDVRAVAVGSGQALALGRRGDADVLIVHSPADEMAFMDAGHGARRETIMQNDFVIVGPPADPAGVRGRADAGAALRAIAAHDEPWVSRGDSSGTHRAELALRRAANTPLRVIEAGQGMAETLVLASERSAYTLTDRSTYLTTRDALQLDILVAGDPQLRNVYSVVTVRGAANSADAAAFADWLLSVGAQQLIASFGRDRFGSGLFTPARLETTRDGPPPR